MQNYRQPSTSVPIYWFRHMLFINWCNARRRYLQRVIIRFFVYMAKVFVNTQISREYLFTLVLFYCWVTHTKLSWHLFIGNAHTIRQPGIKRTIIATTVVRNEITSLVSYKILFMPLHKHSAQKYCQDFLDFLFLSIYITNLQKVFLYVPLTHSCV